MWFSRDGGVGQAVGLDDLRGLFQPMVLWFNRRNWANEHLFSNVFSLLFHAWPRAVYCLLFKTCSESRITDVLPSFSECSSQQYTGAGQAVSSLALHLSDVEACSSSPSAGSGRQAGEAGVKAIDLFGIPRLKLIRLQIFFKGVEHCSCSSPSCFDLCYSCERPAILQTRLQVVKPDSGKMKENY